MSAIARTSAALGRPPRSAPSGPPVAQLRRARQVTRAKASTFSLACRLLPARIRDDVYLLYLVFRTLDDLVDEGDPGARARVEAVAAWAEGRSGEQTGEVGLLRALSARRHLPREAIADFCAGMRQDLATEAFGTEAELDQYCYRVAGTVGIVMTAILGAHDQAAARPAAAALGMAMQRTNILRDIEEDAAAGRVYLARETLVRHAAPAPSRSPWLMREQIARADALYDQGLQGLAQLRAGRRAIAAAAAMYREILRELERRRFSPGRAVVSRRRKLAVAAHAAYHA